MGKKENRLAFNKLEDSSFSLWEECRQSHWMRLVRQGHYHVDFSNKVLELGVGERKPQGLVQHDREWKRFLELPESRSGCQDLEWPQPVCRRQGKKPYKGFPKEGQKERTQLTEAQCHRVCQHPKFEKMVQCKIQQCAAALHRWHCKNYQASGRGT